VFQISVQFAARVLKMMAFFEELVISACFFLKMAAILMALTSLNRSVMRQMLGARSFFSSFSQA
jgi:hypothetical protein